VTSLVTIRKTCSLLNKPNLGFGSTCREVPPPELRRGANILTREAGAFRRFAPSGPWDAGITPSRRPPPDFPKRRELAALQGFPTLAPSHPSVKQEIATSRYLVASCVTTVPATPAQLQPRHHARPPPPGFFTNNSPPKIHATPSCGYPQAATFHQNRCQELSLHGKDSGRGRDALPQPESIQVLP
jgi:hypothetical protein